MSETPREARGVTHSPAEMTAAAVAGTKTAVASETAGMTREATAMAASETAGMATAVSAAMLCPERDCEDENERRNEREATHEPIILPTSHRTST